MIETDVCVIGAGSGGLSVAAGAVQMGARVVLIEGHKMGGDCLNYGCVPSKALLAAGRAGMSYPQAQAHVQAAIEQIAPHDSQDRFEALGCTVIRGWARFVAPDRVAVGDQIIKSRRFVIATGARAVVPPIPGLDPARVLTNETVFTAERPDHLVILGGGPIGVEMALAHRRLGCRVTLVDAGPILAKEDPEAADIVLARLRSLGVDIIPNAAVEAVEHRDGVTLRLAGQIVRGSHLLVAAGRRAAVDRLDLPAGGVACNAAGVAVDSGLRSVSNRRVYAIGDAAGGLQFTHVAGYQAGVILRSMLFGLRARAASHHIPRVTYCEPELAQIGLTEAEARRTYGSALTVVRQEFAGNDRAIAQASTEGFAKLMIHKGRPVGVTIVGPNAGELIATWALVMANGHKLSTITAMVLPYPTLSEINKRLVGAYFSPKLFDSPLVKRVVGLVQRWVP